MPNPIGLRPDRPDASAYRIAALEGCPETPVAAYSVCRRVLPGYSGPVLRVRRPADNVEKDLYGDGRFGRVRLSGLKKFAGWNLFGYTAAFENAAWDKTADLTVTDTAEFATVSSTGLSGGTLGQRYPTIGAFNYTAAFDLQADTTTWVRVRMQNAAATQRGQVWVELSAASQGSVTYTGGTAFATATTTLQDDGWVRVVLTAVVLSGGDCDFQITVVTADGSDTAAAGEFRVRRPQLDYGSVAQPYDYREADRGGELRVVTVYDQIGEHDLTQATANRQPYLLRYGQQFSVRGLAAMRVYPDSGEWLSAAGTEEDFRFLNATGGSASVAVVPYGSSTPGVLFTTQAADGDAGVSLQLPLTNQYGHALQLGRAAAAATVGTAAYSFQLGPTSDARHFWIETDPDSSDVETRVRLHSGAWRSRGHDGLGPAADEDASGPLTVGSDGTRHYAGLIAELILWDTVSADLRYFVAKDAVRNFGERWPEPPELILDLPPCREMPSTGNALLDVIAQEAETYVWERSTDFCASWEVVTGATTDSLTITGAADLTHYRCRVSNRYGETVSTTCRLQAVDQLPFSAWHCGMRDPLFPGYSGPTVRLRRGADNTEQDFSPPAGRNRVPIADFRTFAGWNLFSNTHAPVGAGWATNNGTGTGGQTDILGTTKAAKIVPNAGSVSCQWVQTVDNLMFGRMYVFSADFKSDGIRHIQIAASTGFNVTTAYANFDLQTGRFGQLGSSGFYITAMPLGGGWYRVWFGTNATSMTTSSAFRVSPLLTDTDSRLPAETHDGVAGILVARPMLHADESRLQPDQSIRERPVPRAYEEVIGTQNPRTLAVATVYDQSGAGRHQVQATSNRQPTLMLKGGMVVQNTYSDPRIGSVTDSYGALAWELPGIATMYCGSTSVQNTQHTGAAADYNFLHQTGGTLQYVGAAEDTAGTKRILTNRTSTTANSGIMVYYDASEVLFFTAGRTDVGGTPTSGTTINVRAFQNLSNATFRHELFSWNLSAAPETTFTHWWDGYARSSMTVSGQNPLPAAENANQLLALGASAGSTSNFHRGTIDNVRVWNTPISPVNISRLLDSSVRWSWRTRMPYVRVQPEDRTAAVGDTVEFAISVDESSWIRWQYSDDGTIWTTTDTYGDTLEVFVLAELDGRQYRALVGVRDWQTVTAAATLTVTGVSTVPTITADPPDSLTLATTDTTLQASQDGAPPSGITWEYSDDGNTWTEV